MDVQKLSDTGALGALVEAADEAGYCRAAGSDGARLLGIRAIQKREALLLELLRRLREYRERVA